MGRLRNREIASRGMTAMRRRRKIISPGGAKFRARPWLSLYISFACVALMLSAALAPAASASKQVIAYFGTESGSGSRGGEFRSPGDIAINSTGAGPANRGEIYVVDQGNQRIQRFSQNDNGTAEPYDDSYEFVGAWG